MPRLVMLHVQIRVQLVVHEQQAAFLFKHVVAVEVAALFHKQTVGFMTLEVPDAVVAHPHIPLLPVEEGAMEVVRVEVLVVVVHVGLEPCAFLLVVFE